MPSPLTEAREAVAAALAGVGVRVYPDPVESPSPPCLQVSASNEWIVRPRLGGARADVNISVRVTVPVVSGNAEALANLEDLVWSTMKLVPVIGTIEKPRLDNSNQTDVYMVDLPTMVTVKD